MKHANVLATVFVLLVGVWAIFYFQQKSRRFTERGLHFFLGFLVLFNLHQIENFFWLYFMSNLTSAQWQNLLPSIKRIDWPVSLALLLGLTFCQFKLIAWQRQKKLSRWFLPALLSFAAGLVAYFLLAGRYPALMPKSAYLHFWNLYAWPLNVLKALWLVRLLAESRGRPEPELRRANRAFAWLFLGQILSQAALLLMNMAGMDGWIAVLTKPAMIYVYLLPVIWLNYYYIPWAGAMSKISNTDRQLDALKHTHGISAREMEILKLVLDGKTNRQIEDMLYISVHTVKNHVSHLYRKIGVRNHRQLTHFIATRQQENH